MTNPPSWSPEGPNEAIGLGVVSGGKTVPRPLPGRAMAGLAGVIITALSVAAYVASDFIDADPIETGSIASGSAVPSDDGQATKTAPVLPSPVAVAAADENKVLGDLKTAAKLPVALPKSPTVPPEGPINGDPAPLTTTNNDVRYGLRKQIVPTSQAPSVLAPPTSAEQVADLAPDVAVAESEAEVAKLEEALAIAEPAPESEVEIARLERAAAPSDAALTPEDGDTAAMGGPYIPVSGMTATRVTRYVNLRDGPADEASVVAVIPTNATVQAETGCEWCVVTYKDKRGYIYKGFLTGRGGGAKSTGNRSRAAKKLTGKPGLY